MVVVRGIKNDCVETVPRVMAAFINVGRVEWCRRRWGVELRADAVTCRVVRLHGSLQLLVRQPGPGSLRGFRQRRHRPRASSHGERHRFGHFSPLQPHNLPRLHRRRFISRVLEYPVQRRLARVHVPRRLCAQGLSRSLSLVHSHSFTRSFVRSFVRLFMPIRAHSFVRSLDLRVTRSTEVCTPARGGLHAVQKHRR